MRKLCMHLLAEMEQAKQLRTFLPGARDCGHGGRPFAPQMEALAETHLAVPNMRGNPPGREGCRRPKCKDRCRSCIGHSRAACGARQACAGARGHRPDTPDGPGALEAQACGRWTTSAHDRHLLVPMACAAWRARARRGREHEEQHAHEQRRGSRHAERGQVAVAAAREAATATRDATGFSPRANLILRARITCAQVLSLRRKGRFPMFGDGVYIYFCYCSWPHSMSSRSTCSRTCCRRSPGHAGGVRRPIRPR